MAMTDCKEFKELLVDYIKEHSPILITAEDGKFTVEYLFYGGDMQTDPLAVVEDLGDLVR